MKALVFVLALVVAVLSVLAPRGVATGVEPCPGLPNSTGAVAQLEVTDAGGGVVDVVASQMQPGNRVLVLYGALPMNPVPFGQGELCLHPAYVLRGATEIVDAGGGISASFAPVLPVGSMHVQALYRDHGGRTFNLSGRVVVFPLGDGQ